MRTLSAIAIAALAFSLPLAANAFSSGNYDGLLVAQDTVSGAITGGFSETRDRGSFSCAFQFRGKMGANNVATVETFEAPDSDGAAAEPPIKGSLIVADNQVVLRLDSNPDGCDVEGNDFTGKTDMPLSHKLTDAYPWQRIAMVNKERTHLYETDSAPKPRKGYLVEMDVVGVGRDSKGRAHVDFVGSGTKITSGWLPDGDLYP